MSVEIRACKVHISKLHHTSAILARLTLYNTQKSSHKFKITFLGYY